ncbi:unnamed protein product [Sphagnum jensenii]|uniref:Uncharacterized protein n=1 Tax=Sphagnum jensenii TaxID=128206 RepID=A0ABP1BBR2_9BRYO
MSVMAAVVVRELGMMHLVIGALGPKTPSTWKDTLIDRDHDRMSEQGQAIVTKKDDADTSDSDANTDSSECYDSKSSQLKQVDCEEEFNLEELVNSEGPQEMLRLMLQEQGDVLMTEELIDSDDYANWIRWVSDAKQSGRAAYGSTQDLPDPLQL